MREIKFRAWDKDAEIMKYSSGLHQIIYGGASDDIGLGISLHWSVKNSHKGWDRERNFKEDYKNEILVVMQYTGLKDKNSKEIYEGDIIKVVDNGRQGRKIPDVIRLVEWVDNRSEFGWEDTGLIFCKINEECFEVLGNKYENPELLEKEE